MLVPSSMGKKMNKKTDMTNDTTKEAPKTKSLTLAEKMWSDIKDTPLEMFALPKQFAHMYCEPIAIEPSKLYLKYKVPAVLPALEEALKGNYTVERLDKYLCISPAEDK